MRGFAKAFLTGNITRDPETRMTPNGTQVTSFTIAVNRVFKGADGVQQEKSSFINCVAWGRLGETIAQYAKRGTGMVVSGRIDQQTWEDKNTGQKRSRIEIYVEDFCFAGGGGGAGAGAGGSYGGETSSTSSSKKSDEFVPEDLPEDEAINLDDIPF